MAGMSPTDYQRQAGFRRSVAPRAAGLPILSGPIKAYQGYDLNDPALHEMMRGDGGRTGVTGIAVNERMALRNSTFFRAMSLQCGSMGMLPLHLRRRNGRTTEKATDHPLFNVLHRNPTISIFDYIGDDGDGGGVNDKRIAAALRSIGNRDIDVEINSPGGNYFQGVAIYNLFRRHPKAVNVQILGIAASAASVIAMAGDTISIAHNAEIMIHEASGIFIGTKSEMAEAGLHDERCVRPVLLNKPKPVHRIIDGLGAQEVEPSDAQGDLYRLVRTMRRDERQMRWRHWRIENYHRLFLMLLTSPHHHREEAQATPARP